MTRKSPVESSTGLSSANDGGMLYPDYENPIILFEGNFSGSSKTGIIPKNGILYIYMSSFSHLFINDHAEVFRFLDNVPGGNYTYASCGITVPVKKDDKWLWYKGSSLAVLYRVYLYPYKR